ETKKVIIRLPLGSFRRFQLKSMNYSGFNALFMFVMLTNFHQVFVGKEFIIFGSFMGGIFTICLKEQLKEYQKLMNQFIDIKKEVH
ncbi:hypothetical protein RZO29_14970, partial [Enterococcus faecalis]|nr:hypothetical protein [Enterococcus faecalis]